MSTQSDHVLRSAFFSLVHGQFILTGASLTRG